jgi:hypothetical protein
MAAFANMMALGVKREAVEEFSSSQTDGTLRAGALF